MGFVRAGKRGLGGWLVLAGLALPALAVAETADGESPSAGRDDAAPELVIEVTETYIEPEREQSDEEALEQIRLTPGGVAIVDDAAIERTRAGSLEDVLIRVPGVYVRARGTGEEPQISIRGSGLRNNFHIRGVNLLIDGFPFQNADGFSEVEAFELLAADRVEVYKGLNSVRFGGSALGGAIDIVTRTGRTASPARVRNEGGSFGFWKAYGEAAAPGARRDAFLGVSHTQQEGFRDHAEQHQQRGYLSVGRRLDGGASLRLDAIGARSRREIPGALTEAELDDDPSQADPDAVAQGAARDFDYGRGAVTVSLPVRPGLRVAWQTYASYQDLDHPLPFGIITSETTNAGTELRATSLHALPWGDGRLDAGVQAAYTYLPQRIFQNLGGSRGSVFSDTRNEAGNLAFYASEHLALTDTLALVGAARLQWAWRGRRDRIARDSDSIGYLIAAPSVGAIWRYAETAELYGNVGYGEEPGLLLEISAPGNLAGDLDELDPQRAVQLELGTRGTCLGERLRFDVAIFDLELRDEIRNVNVDTGMGFTEPRYENIDRSRHQGLEAGIGVVLAEDVAAPFGGDGGGSLVSETAYTYSRFEYVDDDMFGDNDLPGVPRQFLASTLRWQHPSGLWVAPQVVWVPERWYVDSANQNDADAYALWHVRAGFDHERSGISVFVEGRNLADRDHVSAVVVDAGDGRFFQPGDGLGVYGGLEWRWR